MSSLGGMPTRTLRVSLRSSSLEAGVAWGTRSAGGRSISRNFDAILSTSDRMTVAVHVRLAAPQIIWDNLATVASEAPKYIWSRLLSLE